MNILIQFEDTYGCSTIFQRSGAWIFSEKCEIIDGLCISNVLHVPKGKISDVDYAVIVFDLDGDDKECLTASQLRRYMSKSVLDSEGKLKETYIGKLILIPVFFCCESLFLFSEEVRNFIRNIENSAGNETVRLIKLYKSYYDYSKMCPESMYGISKVSSNILEAACKIRNSQYNGTRLSPQRFHETYAKQTLKEMFKKEAVGYKDEIFSKHEDKLFGALGEETAKNLVGSITDGIGRLGIHNNRVHKLLSAGSEEDLRDMILTDETLAAFYNELETYGKSIYGLEKDICDKFA